MNRIKSLVTIFAFSLVVMSLPMVASAQWGGSNRDRDRDRDDDYYGRNRDRNRDRDRDRNDDRNSSYSNTQLKNTIKRLKSDSRDLARFIDRELDRSRYNKSQREDNLNDLANEFRRAADRLESRFDTRDIYKSQREAQEVLNISNRLDRALRNYRLGYDIDNYWNNIKRQLNEISNAYRNSNRGQGRSNDRWGDWKNRIPFPF